MPKKKQITKEKILEAATQIIREKGETGLNARSIADKMGLSTQPVYSEFANMADLRANLVEYVRDYYKQYSLNQINKYGNSYKAYGRCFINFAMDERHLFEFLYLKNHKNNPRVVDDANYPEIIECIISEYGLTKEQAISFHSDMAIYSLGLAVLACNGDNGITQQLIDERLAREFVALYASLYETKKIKRFKE